MFKVYIQKYSLKISHFEKFQFYDATRNYKSNLIYKNYDDRTHIYLHQLAFIKSLVKSLNINCTTNFINC